MSLRRSYAIPTLSAITLAATGCADPIIGQWDATWASVEISDEIQIEGDMPYEISYEYTLGSLVFSCAGRIAAEASLDEEFTGEFELSYSWTCSAGSYEIKESGSVSYDMDVVVLDKRHTYEIQIDDIDNGSNLDVDCEMSKEEDVWALECEDEDGNPSEWERPRD